MADYRYITYETLDDGLIARIMLSRPRTRNAQNRGLLVELGDAFLAAEADDKVRVVILGGVGPIFSSGHDLGSKESIAEWTPGPDQHPTMAINAGTRMGGEKRWIQEWHYFFQNTLRWRNLRKITVAQVQGTVFAAGLMLMWACDLIVAADDTSFADVVGTRLGMCGVEYFAHPWEFGPRRTKEMMLTGDCMDADEAYRLGMVSKVFPRAELEDRTVQYARRLAKTTTAAALLIKESVNQTVDNMGFYNALNACFSLHQMNHSHWAEVNDDKYPAGKPEHGVVAWSEAPPIVALSKSVADPFATSQLPVLEGCDRPHRSREQQFGVAGRLCSMRTRQAVAHSTNGARNVGGIRVQICHVHPQRTGLVLPRSDKAQRVETLIFQERERPDAGDPGNLELRWCQDPVFPAVMVVGIVCRRIRESPQCDVKSSIRPERNDVSCSCGGRPVRRHSGM